MLYDSITVVNLRNRTLIGDVDLRPGVADPAQAGRRGGTYPFWVAIKGAHKAYVSSQRDREIVTVDLAGTPHVTGRIAVGGLPGKMILNREQTLLFVAESNSDSVAMIDTATDQVRTRFTTTGPEDLLARIRHFKGSNPNSLALSPDESTLYVTNGGTNALAVVELDQAGPQLMGRVTGLDPHRLLPERRFRQRRRLTALCRQRHEQHRTEPGCVP